MPRNSSTASGSSGGGDGGGGKSSAGARARGGSTTTTIHPNEIQSVRELNRLLESALRISNDDDDEDIPSAEEAAQGGITTSHLPKSSSKMALVEQEEASWRIDTARRLSSVSFFAPSICCDIVLLVICSLYDLVVDCICFLWKHTNTHTILLPPPPPPR
jgi:hypothetical protein